MAKPSIYEITQAHLLQVLGKIEVREAEKSEERILQDLHAGRLLALHLDDRGYRIPDWQLGPTKYLLTLVMLTHAEGADSWAVYRVLSTPTTRLANRSPMEIVTAGTILDVGDMVCELLTGR